MVRFITHIQEKNFKKIQFFTCFDWCYDGKYMAVYIDTYIINF